MGANILPVSVLGWARMKENWSQFFMIAVLLACITIGSVSIIWSSGKRIIKYYKMKQAPDVVSLTVSQRINRLAGRELKLIPRLSKVKPTSFGTYLGSFTEPPTPSQKLLLGQWDILVVDPLQVGVSRALFSCQHSQVLGRINLEHLVASNKSPIAVIDAVEDVINNSFNGSAFSGILFASWEDMLSPNTHELLFQTIQSLGLDVFLEVAPPKFLKNRKALQSEAVSGLVIRNASIMPNGEKRDYFQMIDMHSTIKAFVSEACMRDFVVLAWETVDDDVTLSNAVIRRALSWCNFYSAIPWIGSESSLTNADLNGPTIEPLSAFGWLKESNVMKAHDVWRTNLKIAPAPGSQSGWDKLRSHFPAINALLESDEVLTDFSKIPEMRLRDPPEWVPQMKTAGNPLSVSMAGQEYNNLGCFPLGSDPSLLAFAELLQCQQRLKSLSLLHPVPSEQIKNIGVLLQSFQETLGMSSFIGNELAPAIKELADLATNEQLRVHLVLDSGLSKSTDMRFWAVYQMEEDGTDIFVSKNAKGLVGTVLHTFLSGKGFPRHECFEAEFALASWSQDLAPDTGLPRRFIQDIDVLSPEERLLLFQHLSLTDSQSDISQKICMYIRKQLIDAPSFIQLKELNTVGYLEQTTSFMELVKSRIDWYEGQGCRHPSTAASLTLFRQVDEVYSQVCREHRESDLADITAGLCELVKEGHMNAYVDMITLSIFCAARKGAFDEIYAEVTDRNPLFNSFTDQAAAFAESFALGSRCEAYFDMPPSIFGKILSGRFRKHYNVHQPPNWINGGQMATSYAGAQIDVNPDDKVKPMRSYQRFTFMSVFAIPALIDIILLTIIGRGLYLSSQMTSDELNSATIALMISLLLSGAIGTWIAVGGPYYLISMAFAAANMFVLIRLIAGIAFTVAGGLIGFVAISAVRSPQAGIIFYLYLIALTIYFSAFAALASFSYPGTAFLSGRKAIIYSIPILFISPIITTFSGHDSAIYLAVIYIFIAVLLFFLRSVLSKWVTWYQAIRRTDDTEIRKWYLSTYGNNDEKVFANMSDPAAAKLGREALYADVMAEKNRGYFSKETSDKMVRELARDWDSTNFLLDWYCRYADVPRPIPYSSGWNIQTKVGLDVLKNNQKGLKLHNSFIHWRESNREIGCGILYFILALLDKWAQMLSGDRVIDLLGSFSSDANRMAVGFALVYYLIGSVLIDTKAQELHQSIGGKEPTAVKKASEIRNSLKEHVQFRRKVYWRTLGRFLLWHVWSLALSTALFWMFQGSIDGMGVFFSYILSYTGLIWYQYTKIFTGPHALKPLLVGICIGLPLGIALKACLPEFIYSAVIGLGTATWIVAILSFMNSKMSMPSKVPSPVELGKTFHAFTTPWEDPEWSQQELQSFYENLAIVPVESRFKLDPTAHPGLQVEAILRNHRQQFRVQEAFPNSNDIVDLAISSWKKGDVYVELLPHGSMGPGIRALSCSEDGKLRLAIGIRNLQNYDFDVSVNCQIIAESLLHSVAEMMMGIPHEYAALTETIVSGGVSYTIARQLREEPNTTRVVRWAKKELLRQLCLGFEADIHWDKLPDGVRNVLINRCLGHSCSLPEDQRQWLQKKLCQFDTDSLDTHVSRCNLGAATAISILEYSLDGTGECPVPKERETADSIPYNPQKLPKMFAVFRYPLSYCYHTLGTIVKFIVIALVADPEFQREFNHVSERLPTVLRLMFRYILNALWIYGKFMQDWGLSFFLFYGRKNVKRLWDETKGMTIHIKKSRVHIQSLAGTFTAFRHSESDGSFKIYQYTGEHKDEPEETKKLISISTYSREMLLHVKEEYKDGKVLNEYHYDYRAPKKGFKLGKATSARIPLGRRCVQGVNHLQSVQYNQKGLIEAGSYMKDGNIVRFQYRYRKNPRFGDELLRAEFVMSHISCTVSWCAPPRRRPEKVDRWIPHSKITEATFVQGADVFESRWSYDHKFHPTIFTTVNGRKIQTPPMIEHDYLGVLSKPKNTSFVYDNPFFYLDSLDTNPISRYLGLTKKRFPVSTSHARSLLWKAWKERVDFDGIIVRWMDDLILRRDHVLAPYWRHRDWGNLSFAKKYMDLRADAIMASADLDDNISSWTPLAVKISDLFNFGPGGDAVVTTRSKDISSDTDKTLHVMAADNGTWPNEGGGVSACRRDMINSLNSIKWHMICESANDFGVPKHQTEQNVQSLKVIPLWGMDFLTPTHGLFSNKLDSEVENVTSASDFDIKMNFIPILTALVKGARTVDLSKADIQQATRALVNLNTYFQESRHWGQVWSSEIVKSSWRDLWLTQEMPNTIPSSEWFDTELPTLESMDIAMELWYRYLFIFSIPVPDKIPSIFQASHHSVSASYGVVCKMKRNVTLQIWDHAIAWRETNLCLSSALCKLSPFVRNCLLGLMRITSVLTLHHADVLLPCADFFNPGWEVEIGTCQGTIEHRNTFRRKIDPVVNGITDMQKFSPVKEIKSKKPTVTMLSHVWYAKDIKIALLAADIIINQWKFDEYHLDIYGAIDKAPTYSTECQEIIASKGLRGRVTLCGTADPMKVLENTWLFLNSSLSEGLPLALGEAALTGAPVVCTDVGASLRVLSDPDDFSRFSAVVAPNDALALAKAQISMLGMIGEWAEYCGDTTPAPVLTSAPTADEVAAITRRMYEKSDQRRELGMKTRQIVQKSFSGDRYLREHEQMLWIGKSIKMMASRAAGEELDPMEIEQAIEMTATIDEEIITIPRSAVHSWRSSAASAMSTLYSNTSAYHPLQKHGHQRAGSSVSALTLNSDFDESTARLPVFAPRSSMLSYLSNGGASPGSKSPGLGPTLAPPGTPLHGQRRSRSRSRTYSYARSISTAGREQLRGLVRDEEDDTMQYRNSDVSTIMREDFLRSGILWSD
ncbi:hypothetical protein N7495_009532 [Penicillium taxi]|uniref:uncharacterized protein n=1 Tax=Penicillium taxi TaxID=168475 RepID=UPI0025456C30|nr:uncharacterized protein N7495_009532 [Penicillium taxi]KAJ5885022.1 hypothetical protein N7495_009532 [Penicillium taxi]